MSVAAVISPADEQHVVVLKTQATPHRYLPIWIGQNEAMAIQLRLDAQRPPRPLTLNLLESVLESSKIKVVEIRIDSVEEGVFIGTLRLKQGSRSWTVDARPSDAIGLALGMKAPIWVSAPVLEDAALDPHDLSRQPGSKEPATPSYEESL